MASTVPPATDEYTSVDTTVAPSVPRRSSKTLKEDVMLMRA